MPAKQLRSPTLPLSRRSSRTSSAFPHLLCPGRAGATRQKWCGEDGTGAATGRRSVTEPAPQTGANRAQVRHSAHLAGGSETGRRSVTQPPERARTTDPLQPRSHTSKRAACRFRPHRPRSTDYLVTKRAEWVVFLSASAIIRTPAVHPRNLCEALADETRISQAHNASALVAARSAWVPGARAGKDGWETGTFSSGPALAFRPFRSYLSTPVTALTSRPARTFH